MSKAEAFEEWLDRELEDSQRVEAETRRDNLTYSLIQDFGRISVDAAESATHLAASPSSIELARIAGRTSSIAVRLGKYLGTETFTRFEAEQQEEVVLQANRRSQHFRRASLYKFWEGVTVPEPENIQTLRNEWIKLVLAEFPGRAVTTMDVAKILYAPDLRVHSTIMGSRTTAILNTLRYAKFKAEFERGTHLKVVSAKAEGDRRVILFSAIAAEDEESFDLQKAKRLTDEELRKLAVKLRQEALHQQDQIAEGREKQQTEAAWGDLELDRWEAGWGAKAKADKWYTRQEERETRTSKEAEEQAQLEIRSWDEQEELWFQEDAALTEMIRLRKSMTLEAIAADNAPTQEQNIKATYGLDDRELKFLKGIPLGVKNIDLCRALGISEATFKKSVSSPGLRKIHATNRVEAATWAYINFKDEIAPQINIDPTKINKLSSSEGDILMALSEGWTFTEIAIVFHLSANQVKYSAMAVTSKLDIERVQAGIFLYEAREGGLGGWLRALPPRPTMRSTDRDTEVVAAETRSGSGRRWDYSWEPSFKEQVTEAVRILTASGFTADSVVNISNQNALERLFEQRLITERERQSGELGFESAVLAMIMRSGDGRRPIKGSNGEYREPALRIMRETIAARLQPPATV